MAQRDVKDRIDSVKNIQKITRAMEMVAAARLRRAEQRIQPCAPTRRAPPDDAAGGRGGRQRPQHADPVRARASSARSASCWSRATAAWPAPSTRRSCAPGRARRREHEAEGRRVGLVRLGSPRRVLADLPRARRRRRLHRVHRPPRLRRRARDRLRPDDRVRRREGRPGRDLLQRLHLAAHPGGAARDAAAAAAGLDPRRGRGGRVADDEPTSARWSSTSPTRRRSSSASSPTTSRSRSTARCSSPPRPSTARA